MAYNEDQPRDEDGKWSAEGGGGEASKGESKSFIETKNHGEIMQDALKSMQKEANEKEKEERIIYTLSDNDIKKTEQRAANFTPLSDSELKAKWANSHHGKETGWGLGKRQQALEQLKGNKEYMTGIGQGRVDYANKLNYAVKKEDDPTAPHANAYNLGYYRGYCNYASDIQGWDEPTRAEFARKYIK